MSVEKRFKLLFPDVVALDTSVTVLGFSHPLALAGEKKKKGKYNLSQVPRRASLGSALNVARLGLNDGAQLWISFKLFSKKQTLYYVNL